MDKYPRVCISAGHGSLSRGRGSDPGASIVGAKATEDDVALVVSKKLCADLQVLLVGRGGFVMLRDAGHFSTADDDAARAGCDTFLEIHLNAGGGTGSEVLFNDPADKEFATNMSISLAASLDVKNRGAKRRMDLAVLKQKRKMAQLLAELFFADNRRDVNQYDKFKERMELSLLNSLLKHWGWKRVKSLPRNWNTLQKATYKPY